MIADLPETRRAHAMVCHWYNPPHLIPIAELSCFGNMDEEVFQQVYDLHVNAGKRPVKVLKDIPGPHCQSDAPRHGSGRCSTSLKLGRQVRRTLTQR